MKRMILGGLLVAAGAAGSSALAADDTGAFYISGLGTYTLLDGHRVSKDDFGYSVELGKDFSPNWAGEINYDNGSFKVRNSGPTAYFALTCSRVAACWTTPLGQAKRTIRLWQKPALAC
jgi:hypothetical protein